MPLKRDFLEGMIFSLCGRSAKINKRSETAVADFGPFIVKLVRSWLAAPPIFPRVYLQPHQGPELLYRTKYQIPYPLFAVLDVQVYVGQSP